MRTLQQSNNESFKKRQIRDIVSFWVLFFLVVCFRVDTARAENGSALLGEPQANKHASVESYPIEITGDATTNFSLEWTLWADTPQMVTMFDQKGYLNVAYVDGEQLKIQRYQADMQFVDAISIPKRYPLFGNVICDDAGNYYVVWAQEDTESTYCVTMCVSKYSYQGVLLAESAYKGDETWDSYWGTQEPFGAGNCSMAINRGVLAVNYGRVMYNGHQSNYILYIDCATMNKLSGHTAYCSHSLDQRMVATTDGGFLALNHGDGYDRSFGITKIDAQRNHEGTLWNFHFREGADRDYGYNETYAQLGSIVETPNAYVFCGSSEKTLSLEVAPTNQYYTGHSESRNLFVQILKKNFWEYKGKKKYKVAGESRIPVGEKPASANTKLFLQGTEHDEGVLWLTNYSNEYYVANPKIVGLTEGRFAVLWEKRAYDNPEQVDSYYAVMDENGAVVVAPLIMLDMRLAGNIDPVFRNGRIYWTTKDENGSYIHSLDPFTPDNSQGNKPGNSSDNSQGNTSGLTPENNYDNEKDYRFTIPVAQAGTKVAAYQGCNFYEDSNGNKRCYKDNGVPVINEFKCDGTYTYYFQMDGTCMKSRLTYHPDGEHVIYLDENGHEVFSNFANVKQTISGQAVDDFCFFDVHGYLYVDVVTFDLTGTKLYYANQYGVMERGKWFEFSDTCKWADGKPFDKAGGKYGYAMEDGTLMTNTATYDWEGRLCYLQGNGVAKY